MLTKFIKILTFTLILFSSNLKAQTDPNTAEALFIYNFLSHVMWPEGEVNDKYVIGVIGTTKTLEELRKNTANRSVGSKKIEIVYYKSVDEINNCHVLLIADNSSAKISAINKKLAGKSCLIISETAGLSKHGADIDFNLIDGKLRYKVNKETAKNKNLFVSAALLQMSL